MAAASGPCWSKANAAAELSFVHRELLEPTPFEEHDGIVRPRTVNICKGDSGFGFTLAGVRPVRLSAVEEQGAAHQAGAREQDRILEINGVSVLNDSHQGVVEKICSCEDGTVSLVLLAETTNAQPLPCASTLPESIGRHDELGFELEEYVYDVSPWKRKSKNMLILESGFGSDEELSEPEPTTVSVEHDKDQLEDSALGEDVIETTVSTIPPPTASTASQIQKWTDFMTLCNKEVPDLWVIPTTNDLNELNQVEFMSFSPVSPLPLPDDLEILLVAGVPHHLRRQVWLRCCNAQSQSSTTRLRYDEIYRCAREFTGNQALSQIEKDLMRTFPCNKLFNEMEAEGTHRLRRVLSAFSWLNEDIGYCQGMGMVAAWLLLILPEAEAYWALTSITMNLLPQGYYSQSMIGLMTDQRVFRDLVNKNLPRLGKLLDEHNIELSLICVNWFLTAFASVAPPRTTLRIWDCFMLEGATVLFKVSLAMLTLRLSLLLSLTDSASIFYALSDSPATMHDPDVLMRLTFSFAHIEADIAIRRDYHRKELEHEFAIVQNRRAQREQERHAEAAEEASRNQQATDPTSGTSLFQRMFKLTRSPEQLRPPQDNRQTEKVVRLSEAIHAIVLHFENIGLVDGDLESPVRAQEILRGMSSQRIDAGKETSKDEEPVASVSESPNESFQTPPRRQSSPRYAAGDETRFPELRDLVAGRLFKALSAVVDQGLVGVVHFWDFIEAVSVSMAGDDEAFEQIFGITEQSQMADQLQSAHAALVAAVSATQVAHDDAGVESKESMFRTLVLHGLNLGIFHHWFTFFASAANSEQMEHMYDESALIRTRIWHQIQYELSALSALDFHMKTRMDSKESPDRV